MTSDPFTRAFFAAWSGEPPDDAASLHPTLETMHRQGQHAWPGVEVAAEDFGRFLAPRVPSDVEPGAHLRALRASDLYLVCGCVQGSERAAASFRAHTMPAIRRAARRIEALTLDDLTQDLYRHLFLPDPGRSARIERYTGEGDVRVWVGVVATRMAIDALRRRGPERNADEAIIERWAQTMHTTEFEHLPGQYRTELKAAFGRTLRGLSARDRNVLRYHLDGLTADQVGRIYNVHRVTVARWLSRIRHELYEGTRAALCVRLGAERGDVESIMRMVDREVSLSIDRLLRSEGGGR